jgi:hypothetical protein
MPHLNLVKPMMPYQDLRLCCTKGRISLSKETSEARGITVRHSSLYQHFPLPSFGTLRDPDLVRCQKAKGAEVEGHHWGHSLRKQIADVEDDAIAPQADHEIDSLVQSAHVLVVVGLHKAEARGARQLVMDLRLHHHVHALLVVQPQSHLRRGGPGSQLMSSAGRAPSELVLGVVGKDAQTSRCTKHDQTTEMTRALRKQMSAEDRGCVSKRGAQDYRIALEPGNWIKDNS